MRERRAVCGRCGLDAPSESQFCTACGSQSFRPRPRVRLSGFWVTLLLVALLWVGTPLVVRLADAVGLTGVDLAENSDWSLILGAGILYAIYLPAGLLVGLVLLFLSRRTGNKRTAAGILAGTALGAMAGFLTCLASFKREC